MITDDDLDRELRALRPHLKLAHGDTDTDNDTDARPAGEALAAAKARLFDEMRPAPVVALAEHPRRRRWAPLLVAAATVLALVLGGLVVGFPAIAPATAEAQTVLAQAAQATINAVDPPMRPDQYRYVATRSWNLSTSVKGGKEFTALEESRSETWVPADPTRNWLLARGGTGEHKWLKGTEAEARDAGVTLDSRPKELLSAPCGRFYGGDTDGCAGPGAWQVPNPAFLAGLPRDPDQLLARLRKDAPDNSRGTAELLVYAADLLRSAVLVPADLRSALYLALAKIDGLTLTPGAVNLDGRSGTALGIDDGSKKSRQEIIIDPATGEYIGEREVMLPGATYLPPGTVTSYSSVRTAVVDTMGQVPAG